MKIRKILTKKDLHLYDYFIYPNLIQSLQQRKQGKIINLSDNNGIILSWGLSVFIGGELTKANGEQVISLLKDLDSPRYLYVPNENWKLFIKNKISDRIEDKQINSYLFDTKRNVDYIEDEHIFQITPKFMEKKFKNSNSIIDELYSYINMEDFFQNGVGVALVVNNEVVGFCLSEYSLKDSLGANIWIDERFQGFGYAKKLTNAFLHCCKQKK